MSKCHMSTTTQTDRAIIVALRGNARMSVTELAYATGVSRTTAKTRLEALVSSGRIRRFTIETDVDVDGQINAITMIALQGSMSRSVVRSLARIPEVSSVYSTNGAWDIVANIKADNVVDFDRVLREIREIPGVTNSESSILLAHVAS